MLLMQNNRIKNLLLSLTAVMVIFFAAELYFSIEAWRKDGPVQQPQITAPKETSNPTAAGAKPLAEAPGAPDSTPQQDTPFLTYEEYVLRGDPLIGYGPRPIEGRIHARLLSGDELVYDVVYSTLPSGWRVTPQNSGAETAVVIFGCSFTWGEGLADEETYPWKLAELLGSQYQVFNFGFQGYGSHHMLAHLENGILDDLAARYKKVYAFYTTIRGHELRCTGYSQWDPSGPWYGFEDDRIARKGVFADSISPLRPYTDALFSGSMTYQKILKTKFMPRYYRFKLHAGIIKEADRLIAESCGSRLVVILWPQVAFKEEIEAEKMPLLDLSSSFPDYDDNRDRYRLHPTDGHPNAAAAAITSEAIAEYIRMHP